MCGNDFEEIGTSDSKEDGGFVFPAMRQWLNASTNI